jgi:hypothetical protein
MTDVAVAHVGPSGRVDSIGNANPDLCGRGYFKTALRAESSAIKRRKSFAVAVALSVRTWKSASQRPAAHRRGRAIRPVRGVLNIDY